MRAYRAMQELKNGLYRTTGEAVNAVSPPVDTGRTLRVLMYHKVNDQHPNPITVPTATFAEQMTLLGDLGYTPVVARRGTGPLPRRRAASGTCRADHVRRRLSRQPQNAAPILVDRGYPAVIFAPVGYLDPGARPLPHEESLFRAGIRNPTLTWSQLADARGGRDPNRVSRDRPPAARRARSGRGAARDRHLEDPARGGARSRGRGVRVRQGLARGLPGRAREPRAAGRATSSASRRSPARTTRRATASSCCATTSSRTRRAPSSSCSRGRATCSR